MEIHLASTTESKPPPNNYPWIEKYRPTQLSDIKGQHDAISLFREMLESNKPVHFLFYGPPGTGKTSSVLSFCNELYDKQFDQYVLSINASYDRGINMVRQKIKPFCKRSTTPFERNGHVIDYKFVILDEADTLTKDAQNALRRCIEIYSYNTRFCFMCNYVNNVITPILSRCSVFHFLPIPKEEALDYLRTICSKESVDCSDSNLELIHHSKNGDLRGCLTTLQSVYNMYDGITKAHLEDFLQIIPPRLWERIYAISDNKKCKDIVLELHYAGYSMQLLLQSLVRWLLENASDDHIHRMGQVVSRMEKQVRVCSDNRMLLHELVIQLCHHE